MPRRKARYLSDGLGDRLRSARERAGLTQAELGAKIGVRQAAISLIERGTGTSLRGIEDLAQALGCSPHWLAFGDPPARPAR